MSDVDLQSEMTAWRHRLYANPETGFEEHDTAGFVATMLSSLGLDVHRGVGGTGVVCTLRAGGGNCAVGLRADMEALNIHEIAENRPHVSQWAGEMQTCGHDGYMALVTVDRIPEHRPCLPGRSLSLESAGVKCRPVLAGIGLYSRYAGSLDLSFRRR